MALFLDLNGRRYTLHQEHDADSLAEMLEAKGRQRLKLRLENGGTLTMNVKTPCDWVIEEEPDPITSA